MEQKKKLSIYLPPAVGYSLRLQYKLLKNHQVSSRYYFRLLATLAINLINLPFRTYERLFINPKFLKQEIDFPPIFIIGHWRSGTTYLHNLMCQDPNMGFVTTYQSVFPDTLFTKAGRFLFEGFMRIFIPKKRKGDNVKLAADFPQEDEFTMGAYSSVCFYHFWMYPRAMKAFYRKSIAFDGLKEKQVTHWQEEYKRLVKKALRNKQAKQFISKNPANTARIKHLLKAFPNAKFIHIHRNPVEVFLSTMYFFKQMMPRIRLQEIGDYDLEENTIDLYKNLMHDYFEQRKLLGDNQLVEVSFADLQKHPLENLEKIYRKLEIDSYEKAANFFERHLDKGKDYRKNRHLISEAKLSRIKSEFDFVLTAYKYKVAENVHITKEM